MSNIALTDQTNWNRPYWQLPSDWINSRVWLFYCPTTIKGVITIIIHHSGHQVEAFISVFLSDVKVKTDNICSRFHIVADPLLLFWLAVIYCFAFASKLPLNPHDCGPDSCSHFHCCCLNTWIREFKVWAMVSFWLNCENKFSFNSMLGKIHATKYTHTHSLSHTHTHTHTDLLACMWQIREGGWNMIKLQHLRLLIAHIKRWYMNIYCFIYLLCFLYKKI